MSNLLNNKKLRAFTRYAPPGMSYRMALIVTASFATLLAMPGWLRSLEVIAPYTRSEQIALVVENLHSEADGPRRPSK